MENFKSMIEIDNMVLMIRGDNFMKQKSMTALVSAFSRAYHAEQNTEKIFDDYLAKKILTQEEYQEIASNMTKGIGFFHPTFIGTEEEALRWVVDQQLSPSPLGRAAFEEKALGNAVRMGAKQYLNFAAGYDTFAYRQPGWASKIQIYELDHPVTSMDKQKRIPFVIAENPANVHYVPVDFREKNWSDNLMANPKFDCQIISFCSLLGISYYLSKQTFAETICKISKIVPKGSSVVFDYPDESTFTEHAAERTKKQVLMTKSTSEEMLASYSYAELEQILSENGFLIYEHLTPEQITEQYFKKYNQVNPMHPMTAFDHVNYCLAVRR